MICTNCNKPIPNTAKTCPYCGVDTEEMTKSQEKPLLTVTEKIALAGPLIVLICAFLPVISINNYGVLAFHYLNSTKSMILVFCTLVSMFAIFVPKIRFLYPICVLGIVCAFSELFDFSRHGSGILKNAQDIFGSGNRITWDIRIFPTLLFVIAVLVMIGIGVKITCQYLINFSSDSQN